MSSIASTIYKSLLKIFLKPKESSTLPEMVAWFRDMNVTNPKPFHAGFCQIETQRLSDTRYWTITPKQVLTDRILVYLHGGSYAGGPHLLHWHLAGSLAKKLSCRAIMLDYKLTPEYVYPTALQESIRLVEHLRQLNPAPPPAALWRFCRCRPGAGHLLPPAGSGKSPARKAYFNLPLARPVPAEPCY